MFGVSEPPATPPDAAARGWRAWLPVLAAAAAGSIGLAVAGAPSPVLFGSLFAALLLAVSGAPTPRMPHRGTVAGQAMLGASTGAVVDPATLSRLAGDAGPVAAATLATIALSVLIGQGLRLHRGVSAATATFASIAGGASGVTAVAGELGADDRVVAVIQYLRVLVIIVGMPVVAALAFGGRMTATADPTAPSGIPGVAAAVTAALRPDLLGLAFAALSVGAGLLLARVVRFPAADLLGPLVVAAVLAVTGLVPGLPAHVPPLVEAAAFALIGLQVGLRFTRASLHEVARLLPLAFALILVLIAACAGLGLLLAAGIGVSSLDGYLATTPGGLYAVLVTAGVSGADVTFVLGVQVIRLLLVLLLAPLLAAAFRRRARRQPDT